MSEPVDELLPALADLEVELGRRATDTPACGVPGPDGERCERLPHTDGRHACLIARGLSLW